MDCQFVSSGFTATETAIPDRRETERFKALFPATAGFVVRRKHEVTGTVVDSQEGGVAQSTHYLDHLCRFGVDVTQLHVEPGSSADPDLVSWLAVDMPWLHEYAQERLLDTLESFGVYPYLAHDPVRFRHVLYVLLDADVPRAEAVELASKLRGVAAYLDVDAGEYVYSFPAGADQVRKHAPLPFTEGLARPNRPPLVSTTNGALHTYQEFLKRAVKTPLEAVANIDSTDLPAPSADGLPMPGQGDEAVWEHEVARAKAHWVPGQRQHLAMGLAGFGTYLAIPEQTVKDAIQEIADANADPDIGERFSAVTNTYGKWRVQSRVAFKPFYAKANVPPPVVRGVPRRLLRQLIHLSLQIPEHSWRPRTRTNDQTVYRKLIELASRYGTEREIGMEVLVSQRDLALKTNLTRKTVQNVIKRLEKLNLVNRLGRTRKGVALAGSYLVRWSETPCTDLPQSLSRVFSIDWDSFVHDARSGKGYLGKPAIEALYALAKLEGPVTARTWAEALGMKVGSLRRRREKLQTAGLVITAETEHEYMPVVGWRRKLLKVLIEEGSFAARERDAETYEDERRVHAEELQRGLSE